MRYAHTHTHTHTHTSRVTRFELISQFDAVDGSYISFAHHSAQLSYTTQHGRSCSDYLPSKPPDNHHSSDVVHW